MPNGGKGQDKRQGEEKLAESSKKQRSRLEENRGPPLKYTNYHSLNAPLDHIYTVTDRGLYRSPEPMKSERTRREIKRNCTFHKDVGHTMDRCITLKEETKRLIRAGHFKEFVDQQHTMNRKE